MSANAIRFRHALCAATLAGLAPLAGAVTVTDAANDFLPTYLGAKTGDLDVLSTTVTYNTSNDTFLFTATMAGAIGTTPTAFYVWGLDRGLGTQGLTTGTPSVGAGVFFDSVVILRLTGVVTVNPTIGAGAGNPATLNNAVIVSGNTISAFVAGSLLPSNGLAKTAYTFNLWPRDGGAAAGNAQISDFAPNASNALVTTAVPEPSTWAMLALGLGAVALGRRRRA